MRQDIAKVEQMVEAAIERGEFESKDDCIHSIINWLVLNDYVNPSHLCNPASNRDSDESIEDRGAEGVSPPEEALLQYEILRDRDA